MIHTTTRPLVLVGALIGAMLFANAAFSAQEKKTMVVVVNQNEKKDEKKDEKSKAKTSPEYLNQGANSVRVRQKYRSFEDCSANQKGMEAKMECVTAFSEKPKTSFFLD